MRIAIVGTSGSGKSTLALRLGEALDVPVIELDAINWRADWTDLVTHDPDEFRRRLDEAIAGEAWISDGNYRLALPRIFRRASDVVWLDYERRVVMARVIRRSVVRAFARRELWPGTGNLEDWRRWLDKEHPIRWAWDTFHARRRRFEGVFADPRLDHLAVHRLRRPDEADGLIQSLVARDSTAP
ncbi:MAG: P-loop NTPase family protein [Caulobacteraceae bacterium]